MKKIISIVGITLLLGTGLSANEYSNGDRKFNKEERQAMKEERKSKKISEIKAKIDGKLVNRIQKLEEARNCVKSAQTREELKNCRPKHNKGNRGNRGYRGNRD